MMSVHNIRVSQFANVSQYSSLCLSEQQLQANKFPGVRHLERGYIMLPPVSKDALPIASLMCEFCKTTEGLEVVRIIVVNHLLDAVFNELVRPSGEILDCLTHVHGIEPWHIENARLTLIDVQEQLMSLCDQNTVLVGHDLNCDLEGLNIVHFRCADTKVLFNPQNTKSMTLPTLCNVILKKRINCSVDYPLTTMELCLLLENRTRQGLSQRSFGSKQELITRVHNLLLSKYQSRLVLPLSTCLRGKDTIRIHCKKWDQLLHIEGVLEEIDNLKKFYQICLPISMKTKSQKKGFFVFLKFFNPQDVEEVLDCIKQTGLYKAEIADRLTKQKV